MFAEPFQGASYRSGINHIVGINKPYPFAFRRFQPSVPCGRNAPVLLVYYREAAVPRSKLLANCWTIVRRPVVNQDCLPAVARRCRQTVEAGAQIRCYVINWNYDGEVQNGHHRILYYLMFGQLLPCPMYIFEIPDKQPGLHLPVKSRAFIVPSLSPPI